jgi:hypothetical protein
MKAQVNTTTALATTNTNSRVSSRFDASSCANEHSQ